MVNFSINSFNNIYNDNWFDFDNNYNYYCEIIKNFDKRILKCSFEYDEDRETEFLEVIVLGNAKEALELWDKLIDYVYNVLNLNIYIFIKWVGENDVSLSELGYKLGKLFSKMGYFLETDFPNSVKLIKQLRNRDL